MATLEIGEKVFYDLPGLTEKIGISIYSLRRYVRDGKLKAVKVGKKYWIDQGEVARLFEMGTGGMARIDGKGKG